MSEMTDTGNTTPAPHVVVLAGPNGAGKSTAAPRLLKSLHVREFVNADVIAQGLSAFNTDAVAIASGRILLSRIHDLAATRQSFAFETTLASRSFAPWLGGLVQSGYRFNLLYFWLPNADAAIARVAERVLRGGHNVPAETIRRRYQRGLSNFFRLYSPLASKWRFYDNSGSGGPRLLARGSQCVASRITDHVIWAGISEAHSNAT